MYNAQTTLCSVLIQISTIVSVTVEENANAFSCTICNVELKGFQGYSNYSKSQHPELPTPKKIKEKRHLDGFDFQSGCRAVMSKDEEQNCEDLATYYGLRRQNCLSLMKPTVFICQCTQAMGVSCLSSNLHTQ